jgi:hypothetical protein
MKNYLVLMMSYAGQPKMTFCMTLTDAQKLAQEWFMTYHTRIFIVNTIDERNPQIIPWS